MLLCACIFLAGFCAVAAPASINFRFSVRGKGRFECRLKGSRHFHGGYGVHEHVVWMAEPGQLEKSSLAPQRGFAFPLHSENTMNTQTGKRVCGCKETQVLAICRRICLARSPAPPLAQKRFSGLPGSPAAAVPLSLRLSLWVSGRRARTDYCGLPEHSVVSRQGQDLRVKDPRSEGEGQCAIRTSTTESS